MVKLRTTTASPTFCVVLQYCTCPAGYELSCPDNGTAPGCVQLPLPSKGSHTVGLVIALLVVLVAGITAWNHQLTADICRLCLGAGNPLGERTSTGRRIEI